MAERSLIQDILLVLPPPWGVHEPHLGLAYLCAYLKEHDYDPEIFDLNIELHNSSCEPGFRALWNPDRQVDWINDRVFHEKTKTLFEDTIIAAADRIIASNRRFIGLSVSAANRLFAIEIARAVKERDPNRLIIVGGIGCYTLMEQRIFPPEAVDIFVIGEGEETLLSIMKQAQKKKKLPLLPGMKFSSDIESENSFIPRPLIKDLDVIPFPTFDEFPLESYYYSRQSLDEFTMMHIPILSSRGCVNRCAFCNDVTLWQSFRHRTPRHICEEIQYEAVRRNITSFVFQDLTINGNIAQLREMCKIIKEEIRGAHKRPVTWVSNCIARRVMTYEIFKDMYEGGCHTLIFGIESGSDKVLKLMRKGYTADTAGKVLADCVRAGIATWINIIVGFPGEGEEEFQETKEFLRKNRSHISKIQNLNVCSIVYNSDLDMNSAKYDAIVPDGEMGYLYWESADGTNTFEVRKRRFLELIEFLGNIGIPVESCNIRAEEGKLE